MAFFDKISKAVTETGQKTIAKTKEIADTSRLNSLINEEEKNLSSLYCQLGKLYFSIHKEDCKEEFVEMIKAIADAEAKINDCKKQLQDIKGVQCCEKCGAELSKDAAFCSSCGAPIPKIETVDPADYVKCGNCGAMVKKGMRFCTACGKPLEPVSSVVTVAEDEPETLDRVCSICGAKVDDSSIFCTECGNKL